MSKRLRKTGSRSHADAAAGRLLRAGLEAYERPQGRRPNLTRSVDELDDHELMELFGELVAWSAFVNTLLNERISDAEQAEEDYEQTFSTALTDHHIESVTVAKAYATASPAVAEAKEKFQMLDAERRAFRAYYENLKEDQFYLSRELTRRGHGAAFDRRDDRWGKG